MAYEFRMTKRVEFSETDMAGIVHYANFFRYMESAEHAFYRSLGFSVVSRASNPPVGFPRVHAECDYKKPLQFEDEFEIHLLVREKRARTIQYEFRFSKLTEQREEVARGGLVVVCVMHGPDGKMKAVPIPSELAERIDPAPATLLA